MELQGKVIAVLPMRSGDSKKNAGEKWYSQEYVIETRDQYPKKMVFNVWGIDKIQRFNIKIGDEVNVAFDIDAREWNGRWYNDIRAFDVQHVNAGIATASSDQSKAPASEDHGALSETVKQMGDMFEQVEPENEKLPF